MESIKTEIENGLLIQWKTFSLDQQDNKAGPDFKIWDLPDYPAVGFPALVASKAAKNQGEPLFIKFHLAVFEAWHKWGKDISNPNILKEIAETAGLDRVKFEQDITEDEARQAVGDDHRKAMEHYNVFGVPTLVFDNKRPVFVKLGSIPNSPEERISLFESIYGIAVNCPCLLEIKRPEHG